MMQPRQTAYLTPRATRRPSAGYVQVGALAALMAASSILPVLAQSPAPPGPASPAAAQGAATPAPPPLAAAPAKSGPVYHLLGFALNGTKRVDTAALIAALPEHEGDVITPAQIASHAKQIGGVLKARHIHGDMTTATLEREGPGHWIWVIWDVHLIDALSNAPRRGNRHFASQSFAGNARLSTDQLVAATGLHAGDSMPDGALSDARTGIEQAYDHALPGAAVAVRGKVRLKKDDSVVIDWQIDEAGVAPG